MATFAYALRTEQREESTPGTSESTGKPGSTTWLDAVAALVPAEVLAIHAFVVSFTTETREVGDEAVTRITDPGTLKAAFWILMLVAAVIYLAKKGRQLVRLDALRVLVPPLAFVLWTMLTPNSAFDATFPGDISENQRLLIAVVGAVLIGYAAKALAVQADKKE